MTDFSQFGLPAQLNTALEQMKYTTPTPIQVQAIPLALKGHDILGSAQTGTGKTAAFGIPLVAKILSNPRGNAIVLTPTRELASQVMEVIVQLLGKRSFIQAALLIGGDSMHKQTAKLRMRPRIIVGTPGRINDHLERGNLILHDTNFLVLDETDRMLDMGFGIQIDRIVKFLPVARQTLMFSATIPPEIAKMSAKYLKSPERIAVGSVNAPIVKIKQEIIHVNESGKYDELAKQIDERTGSIIVFVKTKRGADRLSERLNKQGNKADTIHGDLHQRKREKVIQGFRDMKFRILVATDIAARGLDIPHIEHVVNYDLPQCPEDYIHRIGRTGRNGSEGAAVCLISPDDGMKWRAIHRLLHPNEAPPHIPRGAAGDSKPRQYGPKKSFGGGNGGKPRSGGGNTGGAGGNKKPFARPFKRSAPKAA
ncbi:MAG: DEAD/DEAH box helicase [Rickettsiales bacterium]|jgi:ATP-dependent RNA helicase DeaD